ncbi:hypothetical protein BC830DRAFT_1246001 [Chytriomyces sp. MP71]|nr:hypothetical protein BC830DRAFT_1247484 [Chytriomyces sp. MP71]KAI8611163.1 hypothetical protein BC830DRAFT_1246001 [Chytriomyces sp. MP71]
MRLRARIWNETKTVGQSLTPQSTLQELKTELVRSLQALEGTLSNTIQIKTGFPPKIVTADDSSPLATIGIKDGETLLIEVGQGTSLQSSTSSMSAPPSTISNTLPASTLFGHPTISATLASANAAPASTKASSSSPNDELIQVSDGTLLVRPMKDDNSCLFHTIAHIFHHNASLAPQMRVTAAAAITRDPLHYSTALLGRPNAAYARWIARDESWGGAIELAVFSAHFACELWSVDVAVGRVDRFGEGCGYERAAIVFYSGIHYDAVVVSPVGSVGADQALMEFDVTQFSVGRAAEEVLEAALKLAQVWKKKHKYTDLGSFTLKCDVCKTGLKGQMEAQVHAKQTGHSQFVEYS